MKNNFSVVMLPGDGIGPEVMEEVRKLMSWLEKKAGIRREIRRVKNLWTSLVLKDWL